MALTLICIPLKNLSAQMLILYLLEYESAYKIMYYKTWSLWGPIFQAPKEQANLFTTSVTMPLLLKKYEHSKHEINLLWS